MQHSVNSLPITQPEELFLNYCKAIGNPEEM